MVEVGTKIKNNYTGERRTVVSIEMVDNPPQPVYITDDGVRRDRENMRDHWVLDG